MKLKLLKMERIQNQRYKKLVLIAFVVICTKLFSQEKYQESFLVKEDVLIQLDAKYTNVIVETWNKNNVSITGEITNKNLSKEEKERLQKEWNITANGNSSAIQINSNSDRIKEHESIDIDIEDEISFIEPMIENIVEPIIENLAQSPLSEDFSENMSDLNFDYEAYKKNPEGYMKEWEKLVEQIVDKEKGKHVQKKIKIKHKSKNKNGHAMFGFPKSPFPGGLSNFNFDDNAYKADKNVYLAKLNKKHKSNVTTKEVDTWLEEVKKWEKKFEDKWEQWGEKFGASMEEWGENFGSKMEEWGRKVENWAEKFAVDYEKNEHNNRKFVRIEKHHFDRTKKSPRTLIIKVPEKSQLSLVIKYGNLSVENLVNNSNVTLKYGSMNADKVYGSDVLVKADYSSVLVRNWKSGSLDLKYSKDNLIENAGILNLVSSASDITLENLYGDAIINGSFGDLKISEIAKDFENLDIVLENTDAELSLPKSSYSLYFNGNKSKLKYPNSKKFSETKNGASVIVKGKEGSGKSTKNIHITAKYSDVVLE